MLSIKKYFADQPSGPLNIALTAPQAPAPSKSYKVKPQTIFNSEALEKLFQGKPLFFNGGKLRVSYESNYDVIRLCSEQTRFGSIQ